MTMFLFFIYIVYSTIRMDASNMFCMLTEHKHCEIVMPV